MHWSTCCSKACVSNPDGRGHSWPPSAVGKVYREFALDHGTCRAFLYACTQIFCRPSNSLCDHSMRAAENQKAPIPFCAKIPSEVQLNTLQVHGLARIPGLTQAPYMRILSCHIAFRDPLRLIPFSTNARALVLKGMGRHFVPFLFVVVKPKNLYFASRLELEVNPLGAFPLWLRSSSCGPTEGTPSPKPFVCLFVSAQE